MQESQGRLERQGTCLIQQEAWRQSQAPCPQPQEQVRGWTQGFLLRPYEGHEGKDDRLQEKERSQFSHQQVPSGLEVQVNKTTMKNEIIEAFTKAIEVADEATLNEVRELCNKLGFLKNESEETPTTTTTNS